MPRTKEQFAEMREKTRGVILETSLKLFAEKGYDRTSMNDIAVAAGISKGLAYNYFVSKQVIAEAILDQALNEFEMMFDTMEQVKDPYKVFEMIINASFDMIEHESEHYRLFLSLALQPEILEKAKEKLNMFYNNMYREFEKILKKMGFKNVAAEAKIFGAIYDGIFINYMFFGEKYPLKSMRKVLLKKYSKTEIEKLLI